MNNLNSISEYQKLIFSKGLDESSIDAQNLGNIKNLSENYPFVVFITNLTNDGSIDGNYNIMNLWLEGKRLTRFIGVSKENSEIRVGNHTLQLKFDYDSGLLGIYDKNTLDRVEIDSCIFENMDRIIESIPYNSELPFYINSKTNEFKIRYKFIGTNDTDNIGNVSKSLIYDDLRYFLETKNEPESTESNKEQYVVCTYSIKESTGGLPTTINYESAYSDEVTTNKLNLVLYLNPISYNISINNTIITESFECDNNKTYSIKLNFEPSNINSINEHQIYVELFAKNINIIGGDSSIIQDNDGMHQQLPIIGGTCNFTIQTPSVEFNLQHNAQLNFKIKYVLNNEERVYSNLSKSVDVIINGDQSDKYFYFGYENPMDENFDTSLLQNFTNIGASILYDSLNDTDDHTGQYFYCAIPYTYKDIVKPRWYAYTINQNETRTYVDCRSWFSYNGENDNNQIKINGIRYVVYKRSKDGKFYGLIK